MERIISVCAVHRRRAGCRYCLKLEFPQGFSAAFTWTVRRRPLRPESAISSVSDAREALEHFRNASREQRDREARQHEQQLQYLQREWAATAEALTAKQTELRSALQEKADALAQLSAARAERRRQVDEQLRELKPAVERLATQNT
ncbi:hypothetical protein [Roseateles sp. P5_E11]